MVGNNGEAASSFASSSLRERVWSEAQRLSKQKYSLAASASYDECVGGVRLEWREALRLGFALVTPRLYQ